ncbi:hypothetical protein L6164_022620 [Bauhinia variegata]|uniref:Uncharacterized protein n=1 Tax=Bauhinia variegata TaxID=167791 RepID=A0ACB9MFT4_BAUVA|nr:hypothetical protein L6164_022620 [Bauhinia variegata]
MREGDAIAIRTCRELEGNFFDYLAKQYRKPVLLSGPVLPEAAKGELEERHGGFGSMWESLLSDTQIVLVPYHGEQALNTRLLVEELKVAIEVQREENGWVSRENLSKAIKLAMDKGSQISDTLKKNHAKWKEIFASPGLMYGYADRFIQNLQELLNK